MIYYGRNPYFDKYMYLIQQNQPIMPQTPNSMPVDIYTYPQNYPAALELMSEAISTEINGRIFYVYFKSLAPTQEEKDIIQEIMDDAVKHFGLFRQIYYELTGQIPEITPAGDLVKPNTYCDAIKQLILFEIGIIKAYSNILYAMQDRRHINMLIEIISDEQNHINYYILLLSNNKC
ncbi:MAG: hypothetical protein K0Q97_2586 [Bacillota bacterium]|nr:hypothetical protein [Bacillota bacterium]